MWILTGSVEHFAGQHGGDVLSDAANAAKSADHVVCRVVLFLVEVLRPLGLHLANHLDRHHKPAAQAIELGAEMHRDRPPVARPQTFQIAIPRAQ